VAVGGRACSLTTVQCGATPHGAGVSSLEIDARWNSMAYAEEQERRWDRLPASVADDSTVLEYKLLSRILPTRSYLDNAM